MVKKEAREPVPVCQVAPSLLPFVLVGVVGIVAGGLVAAVSRPLGWDHGSWASAYLVLVVGVAQIGLGAGQAAFATSTVPKSRIQAQLALVNGASALVIGGTLLDSPITVTVGCALFVAALVLFASSAATGGVERSFRLLYVALLVLLIVSTPVGIALSWLRA